MGNQNSQQQSTPKQTTQSPQVDPEELSPLNKCSNNDCGNKYSVPDTPNNIGGWQTDRTICMDCNREKIFKLVYNNLKRNNFPREFWNIANDEYFKKFINWDSPAFKHNAKGIKRVKDRLTTENNLIALLGSHGTGKTLLGCYLAACMGYWRKSLYYTKQNELSIRIRGSYNSKTETEWDIYRELINVNFLVIDEIGAFVGGSDADSRYLQAIISGRHDKQKSLVLISNLDYEQFIAAMGSWITDRLKGSHVSILNFSGDSMR